MYSVRDSLRPLIVWGYRRLQSVSALSSLLSLDDLYFAVLLASKEFKVRLRPELKPGESFDAARVVEQKETGKDAKLLPLLVQLRSGRPPEALLYNIITTIRDRFLGFEALALASVGERSDHTGTLEQLPLIPGIAETPAAKVGLARTWLRCWQDRGFWLGAMPPAWWQTKIQGYKGKGTFKAMDRVLQTKEARQVFRRQWLPDLLHRFTEDSGSGTLRLRGSELSLLFDGAWVHCASCRSVHRPIPDLSRCLDCGRQDVETLEPDSDPVFRARKGFYRKSVMEALKEPPRQPLALITGEHTAQLNAPQNEDVFSKAEENELLFQDIDLGRPGSGSTAIDVLSSTTTMGGRD